MFKIELSEQHINVVLATLGKQPLEYAFDTFVAIRSQMAQQQATAMQKQGAQTLPSPPQTNGAASE